MLFACFSLAALFPLISLLLNSCKTNRTSRQLILNLETVDVHTRLEARIEAISTKLIRSELQKLEQASSQEKEGVIQQSLPSSEAEINADQERKKMQAWMMKAVQLLSRYAN